ncbi:MAG: TatD family hydrolase [Patescibacteria group bacterium]
MFIDSHCHINLAQYPDIKDVIKRSKEANVTHVINPGIDLASSVSAFEMAKSNDLVFAAAGVHPNHVDSANIENMQALAELIANPEIVAVGEIGLDYHRNSNTIENQRKIFQQFISIAAQEAKPIIVHARGAADDVMEILSLYKSEGIRGVWHCFEGDWSLAQRILDLGFHLGFTGSITYTSDENILETIRQTPIDRILLETDTPYLTPVPYRGQINEPSFVVEVARKISELKDMTIEEVGKNTSENAIKLFNL